MKDQNARHTWQSWRDRWVKTLSFRPRPAHLPANAPPTPPTDQSDATMSKNKDPLTTRVGIAFTSEDAQALLAVAGDIMKILLENQEDAWQTWSDSVGKRYSISMCLLTIVDSILSIQLRSGATFGRRISSRYTGRGRNY